MQAAKVISFMKHRRLRQRNVEQPSTSAVPVAEGVIVMDLSFNPVALDRGATVILHEMKEHDVKLAAGAAVGGQQCCIDGNDHGKTPLRLPAAVLHQLNTCGDLLSLKMHLNIDSNEYTCSAFVIEPSNGMLSGPLLALHLRREASVSDAVRRVVNEYHLTGREKEVLIGISMGLTSKELAQQMKISPNTVKSFSRLIMIKMGVSTRTGILCKLLDQNISFQHSRSRRESEDRG